MTPKITLVSMNLSGNCTNRTLTLARALAPHFRVAVIGTEFGQGLWPPLAGSEIPIQGAPGELWPTFAETLRKLCAMIDGDLVIACKPRMASFGVSLIKRRFSGTPVILDVDDDELAQTLPGRQATFVARFRNPNGYDTTRLLDRWRRSADATFCVSDYLRQRYGGVIVPHGVNAGTFDPGMIDRPSVRRDLGFHDSQVVFGFIGTPRPAKGIELLADVLKGVNDPNVRLLVVGAVDDDPIVARLRSAHGDMLKLLPMQPLPELPKLLAATDVVAIPQLPMLESLGQMPAKLTDAMAMGKPIIASALADIPKLLDGCGLLIEPGSAEDLSSQVRWVLANREAAREMGLRARRKFQQELTLEAMATVMIPEIERLLQAPRRGARN